MGIASALAWAAAALLPGVAAAQGTAPAASGPDLPVLGIAREWEWWHQDPASPLMTQVEDFHFMLFVIMVAIVAFVLVLLIYVMARFRASRNPVPSRTTHNTLIEVVWTLVPVLILVAIAVPSFRLLYYTERKFDPELTLVVHGYQWYWGYEYPDQQIGEYMSNIVPDSDLQPGQVRLLSVDNPVVLPVGTDVQILITAGDVIHDWAVPAFGIKQDAVPGRMNEAWVNIERPGIYYGMCSELCGTNHGYMPIEVHAVSREDFDAWVVGQTAGLQLEQPPVLLTESYEDALARGRLVMAEQAP